MTLFVGGNSLIVGAPGSGQDAAHPHDGARARPEVLAHPVHARPDAVRHHRHRPGAGRRGDRPARRWCSRPGRSSPTSCSPTKSTARRRRRSRRCSRRCRSTASPIQGRTYQLARAVLRVRDAEPDRARRHVSAARSAARSLHVPHHHRAPAVRRGARASCGRRRRSRTRSSSGRSPATTWSRSSGWCARCRWPSR